MNSLGVEIAKLVGAIVGLCSGIFITYWQIRQRTLSREMKLEDNPERCGRHDEAIQQLKAAVRKECDDNREDHRVMFNQLGALSLEIAKLSRNGGEKK
jgi:hypothetical protein